MWQNGAQNKIWYSSLLCLLKKLDKKAIEEVKLEEITINKCQDVFIALIKSFLCVTSSPLSSQG